MRLLYFRYVTHKNCRLEEFHSLNARKRNVEEKHRQIIDSRLLFFH